MSIDIDKLYKITAEQMERLRVADTKPYSHTYRAIDDIKTFTIKKDATSNEIATVWNNLPAGELSISGTTKSSYRTDYFESLIITVTTHTKSEEVTALQIKKVLQPIIARALGLRYSYPDCRLIELYRTGKITWDECVLAHKTNC